MSRETKAFFFAVAFVVLYLAVAVVLIAFGKQFRTGAEWPQEATR